MRTALLRELAAAALCLVGSSGCAFLSLGQELEQLGGWALIEGSTRSPGSGEHPTQVLLYRLQDLGPTLVDYEVQPQPGPFAFNVHAGRYYVAAFADVNVDYVRQHGEPLGYAGLAEPIAVAAGESVEGVDVPMYADTPLRGGRILDLTGRAQDPNLPPFRRNVGVIASLDDPRFSSERGQEAFTRPEDFIRSGATGIFMEEPYDPGRIPVLFVHGINGSPQDLRPIQDALDRDRFQAWFLAYPSALRLALVAHFVETALQDLILTYQLQRIYVVAHSMGGLISRAVINTLGEAGQHEVPRVFITLATPFRGSEAAELTRAAPAAVLPPWLNRVSWIDMVPDSHFQKQLYARPLPETTDHHLFFAYQEGEATDGAVSILSQLDPRAEDGARSITSARASHLGIVSDPRVQEKLHAILAVAWERDRGILTSQVPVEARAVDLADPGDFDFSWTEPGAGGGKRFERRVRAALKQLRGLVRSPEVLAAVASANDGADLSEREVLARDIAWSRNLPGVHARALTDEACNAHLATFARENPQIAVVVATGERGVNVCQVGPESDYLQADEAWWQRTWQTRRAWHDRLAYHPSADTFGLSLYLPVREPGRDSEQPPIGVLRALLREE